MDVGIIALILGVVNILFWLGTRGSLRNLHRKIPPNIEKLPYILNQYDDQYNKQIKQLEQYLKEHRAELNKLNKYAAAITDPKKGLNELNTQVQMHKHHLEEHEAALKYIFDK